jgi:serpin B
MLGRLDAVLREGTFAHAEAEGVELVELPYTDEELSLVVFLPDAATGLERLEAGLTAEQVEEWLERLRLEQIALSLPKFELRSSMKLKESLMNLGMVQPFTVAADFSGMTGHRDLYIE